MVTTYRNLKLTIVDKHPVFIGCVLLHQKKDWKTYSKFDYTPVTEQVSLYGLLAFGTGGEKALIDSFKKNFQFATSLRCFIHARKNLETDLSMRNISAAKKDCLHVKSIGNRSESYLD